MKEPKYIRVKVFPKSSKTGLKEIVRENINGEDTTTYKINLKSAPEKGKANAELLKFLSEHFDTSESNISIISGKTDRTKLIKITND